MPAQAVLTSSAYNSAWAVHRMYCGNAQDRDQARRAVGSLSSNWKLVSSFSLSRTKYGQVEKQRRQRKFLFSFFLKDRRVSFFFFTFFF